MNNTYLGGLEHMNRTSFGLFGASGLGFRNPPIQGLLGPKAVEYQVFGLVDVQA